MNHFSYTRAAGIDEAVRDGAIESARFLAGGTNLIDLMKENVERPTRLIDVNQLKLHAVEPIEGGGLRLGALVTNADTAYDEQVVSRYPLLSSAILSGASPQLRNAATNGGNLNQRTRCYYFYDTATRCNKREPGSGCDAIGGVNRIHAILGTSEHCIATHPSDMCVALAALDARIRISGPGGERVIPILEYHRLPSDEPAKDNTLCRGELVTGIDLPREGFAHNFTYLKLRDRLSYAFALVSVAVAMRVEDGHIAEARVALGGVAHKPWRLKDAETRLAGAVPSQEIFLSFADALLHGARGQGGNDFKIKLARKAIVRALRQAFDGTPQLSADHRMA